MTSNNQTNAGMYFFWLFNWGEGPVSILDRIQPRYTFCRIDCDEIYLQDAHIRFTIPLTSIKHWNTLAWVSVGAKVSTNVEITLFSPLEVLPGLTLGPRLFLLPMNVFKFDNSYAETKALVRVLDHLKKGSSIDLHPNPYVRSWKPRRGTVPPVDGWDPTQPPYTYTQSPATLSRLLLVFAVVIVVAPILTLVLGLLLNLLFGR